MLVELTMRRKPPRLDNSPLDGIRILALLPKEWIKDLKQAAGDIVIRVYAGDGTTSAQVRAAADQALADPSVSHWELVSCGTPSGGGVRTGG